MFRPYMWAILRLPSNFSGAAIQECGVWGLGGGGGTRSRCSNGGYHDLGLLQVDYHSFSLHTCQIGFLFLCYGLIWLKTGTCDRHL